MPKTLIIPDIHNREERAEKIIAAYPEVEKIVFLGDYFDNFGDSPRDAARVARWLLQSLQDPRRVHLMGNHDVHYLVSSRFACSGWTPQKHDVIQQVIAQHSDKEILSNIRVFCKVGEYLCSHAGIGPEFKQALGLEDVSFPDLEKLHESFSWDASDALCRAMCAAGPWRGGREIAGPLWADWNGEFDDCLPMPQLVGHTPDKIVRRIGRSYCLDTHLQHYGYLQDDGQLLIRPYEP